MVRMGQPQIARDIKDASDTIELAAASGAILLTVRQVASALGIGRSTTYELINAGQLEVVHIGRSVRVPVDVLYSFVASLRRV